ncbi:MAG: tetratricopeptide repeat protein [Sedimentisphaerales bacterium]|nr:tetratricopeptide repeat protein [Sedimentisphaerales bacterium]
MARPRSHKRAQHGPGKGRPPSGGRAGRPGTPDGAPRRPSGWRLWGLRLALAVVAPVLGLVLLEGVLALLGIGYPTRFFIPSEQKGVITTNLYFGWHYQQETLTTPQPCLLPVAKPPEAIRVFVLGGSAAMGTPDPTFGFVRILEVMLRHCYPDRPLEVINAAMRGINSHVVVDIARQCATLQPDLIVVYMGNNEACGLYSPTTKTAFLGRHPAWIPFFHRIKQARTGQLIRRVFGDDPAISGVSKQAQTPEFFSEHLNAQDSPGRAFVYRNFQENLRRICGYGLQSGASVIISTVASNLRDFPPLGSLHDTALVDPQRKTQWDVLYQRGIEADRRGDNVEAIACYRKAVDIDGHYAELHFRLARCYLAAGDVEAAKRHFLLARDWDALQFRADSRLNGIDAQVVTEYPGRPISFVDAEKALAASGRCPNGILGAELFSEHVHFRFNGDYEMARAILPAALQALERDKGLKPSAVVEVPSQQQCARELGYTKWDEVNIAAGMAKLTAKPPFTRQFDHDQRQARIEKEIKSIMSHVDQKFVADVIQAYREAIQAHPQDWQLHHNLGALLYQLERHDEAIPEFQYVVRTLPHVPAYRILLGYALGKSGRWDQAVVEFREALKRDRHDPQARQGLAWARHQGR